MARGTTLQRKNEKEKEEDARSSGRDNELALVNTKHCACTVECGCQLFFKYFESIYNHETVRGLVLFLPKAHTITLPVEIRVGIRKVFT